MSDLFGNHIVGFPHEAHINCMYILPEVLKTLKTEQQMPMQTHNLILTIARVVLLYRRA